MLTRTRRVSLCVAAGAAAAAIGLGAAFASELPGHRAITASVQAGPVQERPARAAPAPRPARQLAQPPQAPAPAQAKASHATSGGS